MMWFNLFDVRVGRCDPIHPSTVFTEHLLGADTDQGAGTRREQDQCRPHLTALRIWGGDRQ